MEIVAEILMQIIMWLIELFGEFLLQLVFEAIAEWFGHVFKFKRRKEPMRREIAALGYALFGAIAGGVSLWLVPHMFIRIDALRYVNLIVTPVASGAVMAYIGSWRRRRDKETVRIESFAYGYCFAFAMSLVRFTFGH